MSIISGEAQGMLREGAPEGRRGSGVGVDLGEAGGGKFGGHSTQLYRVVQVRISLPLSLRHHPRR